MECEIGCQDRMCSHTLGLVEGAMVFFSAWLAIGGGIAG